MMSNPETRGWGPGWPVNRVADQVPLSYITGLVHKDIHELMEILCEETERLGYKIRRDWSWGFYNRPIGGTQVPSYHSWCLAVDLNAPVNPHRSPLTTDIPEEVVSLWESYGFRWGGRYTGTPDPMHFEFMGSPSDAALFTESAREAFREGASPVVTTPWYEEAISNMETLNLSNLKSPKGSRAGWRRLQSLLAASGYPPANTFNGQGRPDGKPGPGTQEALGKFQVARATGRPSSPRIADYVVGKGTWSALLGV